jgi:hypothetical protein
MKKKYIDKISNIINNEYFNKIYNEFIKVKSPSNYYNLVSYVTNKSRNFKSIYIKSDKNKYISSSYLFALYDDNQKMIMNTLYCITGFNSYENYVNNIIVLNIKGYKPVKKYSNYGIVFEQNIINKKKQNCSNNKWKQVMYFGYKMTYDDMLLMIDNAFNNKVTHIIIPFIELNINNNGTEDKIIIRDGLPIYDWVNFTNEQKDTINKILNDYNIKFICSFGGALSFDNALDGSVGTQYVLNSPNYQDPYVLAENIVDILYINKIYNVDYDIEKFPDCNGFDSNYNYLVYYFGLLHKYTKEIYKKKYNIDSLITGAPQTPYFSPQSNYTTSNWCNIYNKIEKYFGAYIDFYNIQFYNQLYYSYSEYSTIFEFDYLFNTSVIELSKTIPLHKIVVGKLVAQEVYYEPPAFMGYVPLYNEISINTMANYVEKTKKSKSKILRKWFKHSGIMVWLYKFTDSIDNNKSLLQYYNYCGTLHKL